MGLFAHFDIDAFYAQVEQVKNPALRGKPVIVGGNSLRRSVVASASYEARAYGVKSGMPLFQALRLCPRCLVVKPNFPLYQEFSRKFYRLLYSISPDLEIISQDEGVVDLSRCGLIYRDPVASLREKREEIKTQLGLTVSAGMGPTKLVAKLAASRAKPDGFLHIPPEKTEQFLESFQLEEIPGIGQKTLTLLRERGISSVADLRGVSVQNLRGLLGRKGENLRETLRRENQVPILSPEKPRSVSRGQTLERDIFTLKEAKPHILHLSDCVAMRLREEGARGGRVCLRIRWSDFSESQKCLPLSPPGNDALRIYHKAISLAEKMMDGRPVRLLAVEASSLTYAEQTLLFTPREERMMDAVERIRRRFGFSAVRFLGEKQEKESKLFVFRRAGKLF